MNRRAFIGTSLGALLGTTLKTPGGASPLGPVASATEVVIKKSGGCYLYRDTMLPVRFNRTQPGWFKRLLGAKSEVEHVHPYKRADYPDGSGIVCRNPDYETAEFELCVSRADAMVGDYEPVAVRRETLDGLSFEEAVCQRWQEIEWKGKTPKWLNRNATRTGRFN